ncbi:hypothetical protein F4808DRAFT_474248 [Astrocystis sublimbata]|nr:hypothetical protein F4808DRAFT_474248 [Astrocystis sublimbata]
MKPMLEGLNAIGLDYQYSSAQYPTFLATFEAQQEGASWNVSDQNVGSRLTLRDLATQHTEELADALRYLSSQTLVAGVGYNLTRGNVSPESVSVNPYIRSDLFSLTVGTPINYNNWALTKEAQHRLTNDLLASLEHLTPKGAAYLNEADLQ